MHDFIFKLTFSDGKVLKTYGRTEEAVRSDYSNCEIISCENLGVFDAKLLDWEGNATNRPYFKNNARYRYIEFLELGQHVKGIHDGKSYEGFVIGFDASINLVVYLPNESKHITVNPNAEITYYDADGRIIKRYKDGVLTYDDYRMIAERPRPFIIKFEVYCMRTDRRFRRFDELEDAINWVKENFDVDDPNISMAVIKKRYANEVNLKKNFHFDYCLEWATYL